MQLEKICLEFGIKLTEQRKIIANVVLQSSDHPHVEEIWRRASAIDERISLATVYRTINLLAELGAIEKLQFGEGKARYEVVHHNDAHHHHLIDITTGDIIEFTDDELELLKEKIAERLGYKLVDHKLELYGVPTKKSKN